MRSMGHRICWTPRLNEEFPQSGSLVAGCFSSRTKATNHVILDLMPKNIFYLDLNNVNILIKVDNG